MGFEGLLSDADRTCMHERDGLVDDREAPRYRIKFLQSDESESVCAMLQVSVNKPGTKRWYTDVNSAWGADIAEAVQRLREERWQLRDLSRAFNRAVSR